MDAFTPNETAASLKKRVERTPTKADVAAIAGPGGIVEHPDGTWEAKLRGRQVQEFMELRRPRARSDAEFGAKAHEQIHRTEVRGKGGQRVRVAEQLAERVERKHHASSGRTVITIPDKPIGYRRQDEAGRWWSYQGENRWAEVQNVQGRWVEVA